MTAICGGGTSSPRSGAPAFVFLAGEAIQGLLVARFGLSAAWASILAFVGTQQFNLADVCAVDPPTMPTFSAADIGAILAFNPGLSPGVDDKVRDFIQIGVWHAFCECDSGFLPTPPAGPTLPTDAPVPNPGGFIPPNTSTPCAELRGDPLNPGSFIVHAVGPMQLPSLDGLSLWVDGTVTTHGATRPAHWEIYPDYILTNGGGSTPGVQSLAANGLTALQLPTPPAGAATLNIRVAQPSPYGSTDEIAVRLRAFCGGQLPGGANNGSCCPPDPVIRQELEQLLTLVTLIQRQVAPFGYIASTAHTGLSGAGHFDVQGLLGVKVELTTVTDGQGYTAGDPDVLWQGGWINWGNSDGTSSRSWIDCSPLVSLPAAAGQYTQLHYSLPPGVVATITELVREP
ncbi:MAG TPA: hypothetical protein VFH51_15955 [Myxococcota bacterium]|nr:hypothetical protein [Myxococcota bacterium]